MILRRFLLLLPASVSMLHALVISGSYDISFSVFGKIGEAVVSMERHDAAYRIRIEGYLTGVAADIGAHRREIHESEGTVVKDVFVPSRYLKIRSSDHRHETTEYRFDHKNETVTKRRTKEYIRHNRRFDIATMGIVDAPEHIVNTVEVPLPYYAPDDLLSLFFNVKNYIGTIPRGAQSVRLSAGAANVRGEVLITNPGGEKRRELQRLMPGNEDRLVTVVVDQDIFESDRGELYVSLDSDYLAIEAMLKDVLLFGDIRAVRTGLRKKE